MLRKFLDKDKCGKVCKATVFGEQIFVEKMRGQLDEFVWGFLRKNMKVHPHMHSQKETYVFLDGRGVMRVGEKEFAVGKGDVVYIEPNVIHTAWNNCDCDLEFIILRTKKLAYFRAIAAILSRR